MNVMKLYLVLNYSIGIQVVESQKQSEKSVWINGSRNAWKGSYHDYFKTREEAKDYLIKRTNERLDRAIAKSVKLKEDLEQITLL